MKMKKILAAVMAAALLTGTLAMGGCSSDSGKLVMVTEAGFAPYEYYDGEAVVGVDVDIAKEIAAAMGKELEVRDIAFDSLINEVQSGKADFAAAGLSVTPEREEQVDFTINYATSKQVIVVRQDNTEITGPDDVNGKTVSVQLGTVADTAVSDKEDYPDCTVIQQKKYLAAAEDVKSGKADCLVMDELPAQELVKANPELKILDEELFTDVYSMAVQKGNTELLDKINEVLQKLMDEGKIEEFTMNHIAATGEAAD